MVKTREVQYDTEQEYMMDRNPSPSQTPHPGTLYCPMHGSHPSDSICPGVKCNGQTQHCLNKDQSKR